MRCDDAICIGQVHPKNDGKSLADGNLSGKLESSLENCNEGKKNNGIHGHERRLNDSLGQDQAPIMLTMNHEP